MPINTDQEKTDWVSDLTDNKCDPNLGSKIHELLVAKNLETPFHDEATYEPRAAFEFIRRGIEFGLGELGLNMADPSLADTPQRYAKMLIGELTVGLDYNRFPKCTTTPVPEVKGTVEGYEVSQGRAMDLMVKSEKIHVISLCEHHLQTIEGYAYVAYIPKGKLLGLSKFARVIDFFSRRPQVQERLTEQIAAALTYVTDADDIAVSITARHYCMRARGALQHAADTTTNKFTGRFLTNAAAREEFFHVRTD